MPVGGVGDRVAAGMPQPSLQGYGALRRTACRKQAQDLRAEQERSSRVLAACRQHLQRAADFRRFVVEYDANTLIIIAGKPYRFSRECVNYGPWKRQPDSTSS